MSWTAPEHDPARPLRDQGTPELWSAAVRAIGQRHGLDLRGARPFATGSDIVLGTARHVVKLSAPRWRAELAAEARNLEHVAGKLALRTPEPIALGELASWPYVVMTRVPGVALAEVWPRLDTEQRRALARDLGAAVAELHGLDTAGLPEEWEAFARAREADLATRHAGPRVPAALVAEVAPFVARCRLAHGPRVLLHTELMDQHLLLEEQRGRWRPAGLIDFADGCVGPADYDVPALVEFVFRGEPGLLGDFLAAYGDPPEGRDEERARSLLAFGLFHRFGSLARMLSVLPGPTPTSLSELALRLYGCAASG